tara:strand:+ start:516 stop:908 length:393 start_codon:yes stop_codon:yes gene_type:complete
MKKIIKDSVMIASLHLTELLDLSDVEITHGGFYCEHNNLVSLKGAPQAVQYGFNCSYNKLQDLVGAPKKIYGDFNCCNNPLISLKGLPKEIGSYLRLSHELKTKFSEKYIHSICNVGIIIWTHNDGLIRA